MHLALTAAAVGGAVCEKFVRCQRLVAERQQQQQQHGQRVIMSIGAFILNNSERLPTERINLSRLILFN